MLTSSSSVTRSAGSAASTTPAATGEAAPGVVTTGSGSHVPT